MEVTPMSYWLSSDSKAMAEPPRTTKSTNPWLVKGLVLFIASAAALLGSPQMAGAEELINEAAILGETALSNMMFKVWLSIAIGGYWANLVYIAHKINSSNRGIPRMSMQAVQVALIVFSIAGLYLFDFVGSIYQIVGISFILGLSYELSRLISENFFLISDRSIPNDQ